MSAWLEAGYGRLKGRIRGRILVLFSVVLAFVSVQTIAPAEAAVQFDTTARNVFIMDYDTGTVLYDKAAEDHIPTASLSKMMTAYVVFQQLKAKKLSLTDELPVSVHAWRTGGVASGSSTMFLKVGSHAKVEDLIKGMIIQSGNDACIVLAEGIAGSEDAFADMMNAEAKKLGLTQSHFANATGLPDPDHYSSAHDLAIIAWHLIHDFPEYYHYFSELNFVYNGIKQGNRNPLLYKGIGVDGVKTGHTEAAGYCLTASIVHNHRRLIAVITGLTSMNGRSGESERIIDWALNNFQNYQLIKKGDQLDTADVWLGQAPKVPLVAGRDVVVTMPRASRPNMKVTLDYNSPIKAPIAAGQQVGMLTITAPDVDPIKVPVLAGADVAPLGRLGRVGVALSYFFSHRS
jgi:D-alanyl-D-alanine carboxypeptidase (penicillin-binding protein 5/6)